MQRLTLVPSRLSLAIAIAVTSLSAPQLHAESDNFELEEITVYAQKREQSIMEVPVAVSSYSAELMERAQVRDLNDLQQLAPSLTVNSSTGGMESIFAIRGIGTAGQNAGLEQSVGVFIDGVYRGRPGSALSDYVDIAGIEVLKGPQGTLFGRNTSAGVISVRTKAPTDEFGGEVEVSAGSQGYIQTRGFINGGLSDNVAGSLAFSYQEKDGVLDDTVTSEDYNDRDRYTIRGQLLWDINEDVSLRLIADYTDVDEVCCNAAPVFYGPTQAIIAGLGGTTLQTGATTTYQTFAGNYADPFDYKVATSADTSREAVEDKGLSGELNWDLGSTALTVIGSYRKHENINDLDADFTNLEIFNRYNVQDIDESSLEVRWASTGANTIDWTVGFFYFNQENDYQSGLEFGPLAFPYVEAATQGLLGSFQNVLQAQSVIAPTDGLYAAGDTSNTLIDYEAESMAFFGQATWNVTEDLSVTFGLRYSDEEKTADYSWEGNHPFGTVSLAQLNAAAIPIAAGADVADGTTDGTVDGVPNALFAGGIANALQGLQTGAPFDSFSSKYDDDNVSGALSVNYQWSDEFSTYARYAQGYKSGGLNMDRSAGGQAPGEPATDPSAPLFDPENVDSFEIGFKARLLDNTLTLNGAIYYQELEDYQQNSFDGLNFTVRNAATVEGKGFELDYMYAPSERWLFSGGITLQEVDYDKFTDASPTKWQSGSTQDLSGKPVLFTSDTTLSGLVSYTMPVADGLELTAATTYTYSSEYFTGQDNDPITQQDDYWIVNLSLSLAPENGDWQVDLWGKNVGDEEVYNIVFDTPLQSGTYHATVREPMTWGVTGKLRF